MGEGLAGERKCGGFIQPSAKEPPSTLGKWPYCSLVVGQMFCVQNPQHPHLKVLGLLYQSGTVGNFSTHNHLFGKGTSLVQAQRTSVGVHYRLVTEGLKLELPWSL